MEITKENVLVAPCGLSCGHCLLYLAKDDPVIMKGLIAGGINRDSIPCPGCRPLKGKVACAKETHNFPKVDGRCETYACITDKGVDFCYECPDFPCVKLQPCADMASELPHNMKVFNLCYIKNKGLTEWLKIYPKIMPKYRFGKIAIGKGPQLSDEEWEKIQAQFRDSAKLEESKKNA